MIAVVEGIELAGGPALSRGTHPHASLMDLGSIFGGMRVGSSVAR